MVKPHKLIPPKKNPELDIERTPIKKRCDEQFCGNRGELIGKDGYCTEYKMSYDKITFCTRLFKGGWISPDGEFIESEFGSHDIDSEEILEKRYPIIYSRLRDSYLKNHKDGVLLNEYCKDKLIEKGWIDLTGNPYPMMGITRCIWAICISEEKITPQQHNIINEFVSKGMQFSGFVRIS